MSITTFHIHDVTAVELSSTYLSNGGSRTIRISMRDYLGHESTFEIGLFGDCEDADALPRSADFYAHVEPKRAAAA